MKLKTYADISDEKIKVIINHYRTQLSLSLRTHKQIPCTFGLREQIVGENIVEVAH